MLCIRRSFQSSTRMLKAAQATAGIKIEDKSKVHGSYHWNFERALSVITVPLFAAAFTMGSHPLIDLGLGVVLPLHNHLGFGAVIQDYLPKRKFPIIGTVSSVGLGFFTVLSLYGCYQFNTNDVGLTEYTRRLWKNETKWASQKDVLAV